jgi:hypothetical protein
MTDWEKAINHYLQYRHPLRHHWQLTALV